jgi:hypothetical protein
MRQTALSLAPSPRTHRRVARQAQEAARPVALPAHAQARVLTDLQATGWEDGAGLPAEGAPEFIIDDVAAGAALENRAIVEAHVEPSAEGGPGGIAGNIEIAARGSSQPRSGQHLPFRPLCPPCARSG